MVPVRGFGQKFKLKFAIFRHSSTVFTFFPQKGLGLQYPQTNPMTIHSIGISDTITGLNLGSHCFGELLMLILE